MVTTEGRVNNGACDITLRSRWQNDKHRRWRPLLVVNLRASTSNYEYASISLYYECVCACVHVCATHLSYSILSHSVTLQASRQLPVATHDADGGGSWRALTSCSSVTVFIGEHRQMAQCSHVVVVDRGEASCRPNWWLTAMALAAAAASLSDLSPNSRQLRSVSSVI